MLGLAEELQACSPTAATHNQPHSSTSTAGGSAPAAPLAGAAGADAGAGSAQQSGLDTAHTLALLGGRLARDMLTGVVFCANKHFVVM